MTSDFPASSFTAQPAARFFHGNSAAADKDLTSLQMMTLMLVQSRCIYCSERCRQIRLKYVSKVFHVHLRSILFLRGYFSGVAFRPSKLGLFGVPFKRVRRKKKKTSADSFSHQSRFRRKTYYGLLRQRALSIWASAKKFNISVRMLNPCCLFIIDLQRGEFNMKGAELRSDHGRFVCSFFS